MVNVNQYVTEPLVVATGTRVSLAVGNRIMNQSNLYTSLLLVKFLRFISASLIGLCNGVVQRAEPGLDKENDPTFQGHSTKSFTELTGHNPTVAETDMLDFNTQGQQCYLY